MKTKKKGFHQKRNTFFFEFKWRPALRCTPESNYWGDADVDHSQIIGGLYPPYLPHPPGFGIPVISGRENRASATEAVNLVRFLVGLNERL